MIKFLISLFTKTNKNEKPVVEPTKVDRDFDFIDYDGMGNQGRFPKVKKQTKVLTIKYFVNRIIVKFKLK